MDENEQTPQSPESPEPLGYAPGGATLTEIWSWSIASVGLGVLLLAIIGFTQATSLEGAVVAEAWMMIGAGAFGLFVIPALILTGIRQLLPHLPHFINRNQ